MEHRIEYAVRDGSNRIQAAGAKATSAYSSQRDILVRGIRIGREHIASSSDPADRQETEESVATLERDLSALDEAWGRSPLRRAIAPRSDVEISSVERRVGLAAPAMPAGFTRATGTASKTGSTFVGYAAVFNSPATVAGLFVEIIERVAFAGVLNGDTTLNYGHNDDYLLARTTSGSLKLSEDSHGLRVQGSFFPRDPLSSAIRRRIIRGDLSKMSFAFSDVDDEWSFGTGPGGLDTRRIIRLGKLWDVACVSRPCYESTACWIVDPPKRARDLPAEQPDRDFDRLYDDNIFRGIQLDSLQGRLRLNSVQGRRDIERKYQKLGRIIDRNRTQN